MITSRLSLIPYMVTICILLSGYSAGYPRSMVHTGPLPLEEYPNAHLLISAEELHTALADPELVIVDIRTNGNAMTTIPGSVHIAGVNALVDPHHQIGMFLMNAGQFAGLLGEKGIRRDTDLVIFDDGNALAAARLFYALELYGHTGDIRILNGGFTAWQHHDFPTDTGHAHTRTAAIYEPDRNDRLVCDVAYISSRLGSDDFILFDARTPEEYAGTDRRAARGGHIPGSVNIEWRKALADGDIPYFREPGELSRMLSGYGITPDKEVVPYCQSNVRGSHVYFTLRLMGYDSVRPYEGSWSEYGNLDHVPVSH